MSVYKDHITNHIENKDLVHDDTLYVIGVCINPCRYHSRYRITREWIKKMAATEGVKLTVVEGAFGHRKHELKKLCEELGVAFIPLRTHSEIWIKENMINIGARTAIVNNPSLNYLAWIDTDVFFRDPNWANETVHQLQHFPVVQPWTDCMDLSPMGGVIQHFRSFGFQHQRRQPKQTWPGQPYTYAHSGFAWACTRGFYEQCQLMDWGILGSNDHHMAFGMAGEMKHTIHGKMGKQFHQKCFEWEQRALVVTKGEVGFVHGRIEHQWHGQKKKRYYRERWQILIDHKFNPYTDLMYDHAGVLQLTGGKHKLEQEIRLYNRSRQEDSIDEV